MPEFVAGCMNAAVCVCLLLHYKYIFYSNLLDLNKHYFYEYLCISPSHILALLCERNFDIWMCTKLLCPLLRAQLTLQMFVSGQNSSPMCSKSFPYWWRCMRRVSLTPTWHSSLTCWHLSFGSALATSPHSSASSRPSSSREPIRLKLRSWWVGGGLCTCVWVFVWVNRGGVVSGQ